ncbi:MAG TPA: phosphoribosylformylglycinamidine synthase subunit PurL [Solirubrobacteraceae bacterium]|nr:phosphoribosylformylglycinamidine synthase subunit PurL [Solirubrobacteraceae bacterium]
MSAAAADERHRALGLTDGEYDRIVELLEREPGDTELAMLSLMWSEHCAYKHSKKLLRRLPTEGPAVLMGPGENAGVVDVGGGLGLAFKVESHNHPSAVEPFQGAATGVGGILRDVFAVGARPIAVLDSLRFGEVGRSARSRYLLEHAVAGIGHYGNSIGVPTVGGELYFEHSYEQNCLVNAMCLGLAPQERLIRAAAAGPGNVLVLLGALTGRDGIGGASVLASAEFGEGDADKRPTVQIGDPFAEKKLLECSLELLDRELLVSLQDLGAAGLTSSASEMASKGAVGLDIDCDRVPLREAGMEPFEIMVSESQERMLCVVAPELVGDVIAVCERWETRATPIGEVTDSGRMRIHADGEIAADLPVGILVDDCPLYDLLPEEPTGGPSAIYSAPEPSLPTGSADAVPAAGDTLLALVASANLASRLPVFEQYDPVVQSRTVRRPDEADAAVLSLPTGEAIAVAIDGNGRRVACDPRTGAAEVVYECAANLACVGGEPLGLTNCLNFGNPEKGHVAWQLTEAIEGIAAACEALSVPVVGGNVSLYNEAPGGPIYPTPVIGMVGRLPDPARTGRLAFGAADDVIAIVGAFEPSAVGSELAKLRGEPLRAPLPRLDAQAAIAAHRAVREAVRAGALSSAHDIAEGGIATALAECCVAGGIGARVEIPDGIDPFAEALGRAFVISGSAEAIAAISNDVRDAAPVTVIGRVGGSALELVGVLDVPVQALSEARAAGLAALL